MFRSTRCSHTKGVTEVKPDGYQYCKECGRAEVPPSLPSCRHILTETSVNEVRVFGNNTHVKVCQTCTKCGKCFVFNRTVGCYEDEAPKT